MLRPKLPVPFILPKPIPRRLPERKRQMTIAAGFVCSNGLVLCADTEYTGSIRQTGPKVWVRETDSYTLAVAGAGDSALIRLVRNRLFERVDPTKAARDAETELEQILKSVFADHIDNAPQEVRYGGQYDVFVLVGVKRGVGCVLLEHSRTAVAWVESYACVGTGAPVANYIAETMFASTMTVQQTVHVACYLLKQTRRFGVMCGGDSHVIVIPASGPMELVQPEQIKKLEHRRPRYRARAVQ